MQEQHRKIQMGKKQVLDSSDTESTFNHQAVRHKMQRPLYSYRSHELLFRLGSLDDHGVSLWDFLTDLKTSRCCRINQQSCDSDSDAQSCHGGLADAR